MGSADRLLRQLYLTIEEFRLIDAEIPAQMISTLLCVAVTPGITAKEIADKIRTTLSSTSRLAFSLSDAQRLGKPGYGLIEQRTDLDDRRRKELYLTTKGQRLVQQLMTIMDPSA